jgi:exonuclease III
MAKIFSVASWNVEHFRDDPDRIADVLALLRKQKPDVFALYEVQGSSAFEPLMTTMPGYAFQITEGPQTQEILIGVRRTFSAFITQRTEFRSGTTAMRPGQLVTLRIGGVNTMLLFLHLASGNDPRGMGLRDDMLERAFDFRTTLDKAAGGRGQARYMFVGDLNTMGLAYPFGHDIAASAELQKWDRFAARASVGMRRLVGTHDTSWSNGSGSSLAPSSLDHVYASNNLRFKTWPRADGRLAEVALRGWVEEPTDAKKDAWIARYSDHALMYFEVQA